MFPKIAEHLKRLEKKLDRSYGFNFNSANGRKRAQRHFLWMDHGILRILWTNEEEIAPGVWRSNHPNPNRLARYKEMGIGTILNLRGANKRSPYMFEKEACDALGMAMIDLPMKARNLVDARVLLKLLRTFETIEKPFLMHCKSGADRAGLASALYLMHINDVPVAQAKKQLSWRYVHFRSFKTGILDHMLDAYEADTETETMPIREWIKTRYNPDALLETYASKRGTS